MDIIAKKAYAKINLFLDVVSRYADGYHEVHTVMQTVSLADDVTVSLEGDNGIEISCNALALPTDERNIVWRASNLFFAEIGEKNRRGIKINIVKRIPISAGLAGGSTNAAAVLCALNEMFGNRISRKRLLELGATLGADVPFCMVGGTAYADGKGDVLQSLPDISDRYMVIAVGGEGVSTPWAYGELDRIFNNFSEEHNRPKPSFFSNEDLLKNLYNIFEEAILPARPIACELKDIMLSSGACGSIMSGSGPAVFGIFDDLTSAQNAISEINKRGYSSYLARPVKQYF